MAQPRLIHEFFEREVSRRPHATALVFEVSLSPAQTQRIGQAATADQQSRAGRSCGRVLEGVGRVLYRILWRVGQWVLLLDGLLLMRQPRVYGIVERGLAGGEDLSRAHGPWCCVGFCGVWVACSG